MDEIMKDNNLIICTNANKIEFLQKLNSKEELLNIKFMTLNEYKKNYFFDYDIKTIKYLYDKYNMKTENIIELIENIYYIENKQYDSDKLNYLVNIKNELQEKNLLIKNTFFKDYIKKYNTILYNLGEIDKYTLNMFNNPLIINDKYPHHKINVISTTTIEEEVETVFNMITELLENKVDINKIFLANLNTEYYPYIKRFSKLYNINVENLDNSTLSETKLSNDLLNMINDNKTKEEIFENLSKYKENPIFKQIINIINKYSDYNLKEVIELIKFDLKNTETAKLKYKNLIKIKEIENIKDDEYVFLMGFNNGLYPKIHQDTDYITDDLKTILNMSTTIELNKIEKENAKNNIYKAKNIVITYKKETPFNTYFPSTLLDELEINPIEYILSYNYSENYNKIKYSKLLDNYLKYSEYNDDLGKLYYNYGDINYSKYNNRFTKIDKLSLNEYINNKLILSYSSVDNYYKCGFKYYLENILNLNIYETTFQATIGTIFHAILESYKKDNFDFDIEFNNEIKKFEENNYKFNNKEIFFINKLKKDLEMLINTLRNYNQITLLTKEMFEHKISLVLNRNPYIEFKGFVDKIMYNEKDNKTIISIVDYKTGMPDINIKNLQFGLSMQLPIYLYLIKKSNIFKNPVFAGIYLQHIISPEVKYNSKKTVEEQKQENLKLVGYSNSDLNILAMFDSTFENSEMIKSMKLTKDGKIHYHAKTLSNEEMDEINKTVEDKIQEASKKILNADFTINPKIIEGKNKSCKFCKYKDICFKTYDDNVYINCNEEDEESDGEQDA